MFLMETINYNIYKLVDRRKDGQINKFKYELDGKKSKRNIYISILNV